MQYKLLLVDDEAANLKLLSRLFLDKYHVFTAGSGLEALDLLAVHDIALIITDQRMPGMTGIELLQRAASLRPHMVRIILTGHADLDELVNAINNGEIYRYLTKPWSAEDLQLTVERALEHYNSRRSRYELELANKRLTERLKRMTRGVARAISEAMEARDEYVYGHGKRVSGYATAIGHRLGLDDEALEAISLAGFLHDVGKIGTPDRILLKPDVLNAEERMVLEQHPERGAGILFGVPEMEAVARLIRHHHEHFDGSGYPTGIEGENIPLGSRIILVADAYDALTSPRPFRDPYTHDEAVGFLNAGRGRRFDPVIVEAFLELNGLGKIRQSIARGYCGGRLAEAPINIGDIQLDELIDAVESEPTLAVRVLRQVNEVGNDNIVSLRQACQQIGIDELQTIVTGSAVSVSCTTSSDQLWEHSMRCAIAMRLIAEHTGKLDPDEAFTMGLVHDIGQVLLRTLFPYEMESILWHGHGDEQLEREIATFGVDHAQVGEWILSTSGLPAYFSSAILMHHDLERACSLPAVMLIIANTLADTGSSTEIAKIEEQTHDFLPQLGLNRGHLARFYEQSTKIFEAKLFAGSGIINE